MIGKDFSPRRRGAEVEARDYLIAHVANSFSFGAARRGEVYHGFMAPGAIVQNRPAVKDSSVQRSAVHVRAGARNSRRFLLTGFPLK